MNRIIILGSAREQAILAALRPALKAWLNLWCLAPLDHDKVSVNVNGRSQSSCQDYRIVSQPEFTLGFNDQRCDWLRLIFGSYTDNVPVDDIASQILADCREDFARCIFRILSKSSDIEVEKVSGNSAGPGSDNTQLFIEVVFGEQILLVNIPFSDWIDKFSSTSTVRPNLSRPSVASVDVSTSLELSLGEHEIDALNGLAVGDILTSTKPLDTPFELKVKKRVVANAFLGKSGQSKAIYLQEINQK